MNAQTPLLPAEGDATHVLTTGILQNAPVLRVLLKQDAWDSITAFAREMGKDQSNLSKTLRILEEDGALVRVEDGDKAVFRLTDFGRQALQGFDFAEGRLAMPAGFVIRTRRQLQPHALNPRKDWESEEATQALEEMRESIVLRGIRYPLEIRLNPAEGEADWIVSGERRWRALGLAIDEGDMDDDYPIVCQVKDVDDEQHLILALEENVQRRNLSHLEEARAYAYLRDVRKWGTDRIAESFGGLSRKVVQNKLRLLEPANAALAKQVEAGDISYHQALKQMIQPKGRQGDGLFGGDLHKQAKGDELKPLELTPKQGLIVIELADHCEKHPHPLFDGYARIANMPTSGDGQRLLEKGIIASRSGMGQAFAKVMLHSAGAKRWLTDNGFYERREELLHEARAAIVGAEKATQAEADGVYVTDWLNVDETPAAGATSLAAPPPPEEELDAPQLLALVEIVFKANEDKIEAVPPAAKPIALITNPVMTIPLLKSLYWGAYVAPAYGPDYFPAVLYSDKAIELLDKLDMNPLVRPFALRDARDKIGMDSFRHEMLLAQERYATDVLNARLPEPEEEPEVEPAPVAAAPVEPEAPPFAEVHPDPVYAREDLEEEDDADEGRFAPPTGEPTRQVHVVPVSSQNLQASTDFARLVSDRLSRDLAQGRPHWGQLGPEECADVVIGKIEDGDFGGAAAQMAALVQRAGHLACGQHLMRALARYVDRANQEA
jgi:ParB/RepB/Spo0J family partition protein